MDITPGLERKIEAHVRSIIREVMEEVAIEITEEVRNYVARTLYTRPKSKYYDRDGANGGFLGTFADASKASRIVDQMMRSQGDKIYVTFVLRDFSEIRYEPPTQGEFGHHTMFTKSKYYDETTQETVDVYGITTNSRAWSELDNIIDEGWNVGGYWNTGRFVEGIHFREYAKDYVNKYANGMLTEKLKQRGLEMTRNATVGRKRLSVPIDEVQIIIE